MEDVSYRIMEKTDMLETIKAFIESGSLTARRKLKMSNENWIKFEDEMPKLNQEIEVKYKFGNILKSSLVIGASGFQNCLLLECENHYADIEKLEGWRPLKSENLIGCIECTNNFKPKEDEKICDSCFYGAKKDDWTLFEDKLPRLGELIEIGCKDNGEINEGKVVLLCTTHVTLSYKNDEEYHFDPYYYNKWRYKKEKRPDFSKLKEKDMVRLNLMWEEKIEEIFIGFVVCMDEDILTVSPIFNDPRPHNSFTYNKSTVKSIIKINPETKEFEEI